MEPLSSEALNALCKAVERDLGLAAEPLTASLRNGVLEHCRISGEDPTRYALELAAGRAAKGWSVLAGRLLLGHTHYYRHPAIWEWLGEELPRRLPRPPVRALVAGCSTGEEVYTLATLLVDRYGPGDVEVVGIDVSGTSLERARAGLYEASDTERLPESWQRRYLEKLPDGRTRFVSDIRTRVRFAWANLHQGVPRGPFHLVMCRNVLTYMTPEAAARVISHLDRVLVPPGLLVVAPQETFLLRERYRPAPATPGLPIFQRHHTPGPVAGRPFPAPRPIPPAPIRAGMEEEGTEQVLTPGPEPTEEAPVSTLVAGPLLGSGSADWERLEEGLRGWLERRPGEALLDLSAVQVMDNRVQRSIRAALRLLAAAGCRIRTRGKHMRTGGESR